MISMLYNIFTLGPNCKFAHPSFALPGPENPVTNNKKLFGQAIVCHNCHERGHKATNCPNLPNHKVWFFVFIA